MFTKTYSNNLRLAVCQKKDVNVVSFKIIVCTGSKDESNSELGYAHFLEHMFFKSTKYHTSEQILKQLDYLGVSKNAYTSLTHTCYYFKCVANKFEESLKIFSEMFFQQAFLKKDVQKEKSVILEEYKMGEDKAESKVIEEAFKSLFSGTCLGHSPIGTISSIKSVTPEKLIEFKNKHYLSQNVIISVSGNINYSKVDKLVQGYFVDRFNNKVQDIYTIPKYIDCNVKQNYIFNKKDNQQSSVVILYNLKNQTRRKRKAYQLLFSILGNGMSSKLFEVVRNKRGLVYYIGAECERICNNLIGEIFFSTSNLNVDEALLEIKKILQECANGSIIDEELIREKNKLIATFEYSRESNSNIAEDNGLDIMEYGKIMSVKEMIDEYNGISLDEIIDCAKELTLNNNFVVSAVGACDKKQLKVF